MPLVIVRGYTAQGYHKDLVRMDEKQVRSSYVGVGEPCPEGVLAFPMGAVGVSIDPKKFPEMVRFEVLVERS